MCPIELRSKYDGPEMTRNPSPISSWNLATGGASLAPKSEISLKKSDFLRHGLQRGSTGRQKSVIMGDRFFHVYPNISYQGLAKYCVKHELEWLKGQNFSKFSLFFRLY